MACVAF